MAQLRAQPRSRIHRRLSRPRSDGSVWLFLRLIYLRCQSPMSPMPYLKNCFHKVPSGTQCDHRWESPENDVHLTLEIGFGLFSLARIEFSKCHSPERTNDCDHN